MNEARKMGMDEETMRGASEISNESGWTANSPSSDEIKGTTIHSQDERHSWSEWGDEEEEEEKDRGLLWRACGCDGDSVQVSE
jgi:hypothetical protein